MSAHSSSLLGMARATPLSRDERRTALVEVTIALMRQFGYSVSTAQIARAAGVAEGTIFRAFPSKQALFESAITTVVDPAPLIAELDALARTTELAVRIEAVIGLWQRRISEVSMFFAALHQPPPAGRPANSKGRSARPENAQAEQNRLVVDAVARVLEPDGDRLRLPVTDFASLVRSVAFATSHPLLSDGALTDPEAITQLLLHGALREEEPPRGTERTSRPHPTAMDTSARKNR